MQSAIGPVSEGVRIARNTGYLTIAFVVQKLLSFGFFLYYARFLGPADTGKLVTAVSIATLFGIFIDLGLSPILIREISRARDRAQEFLGNVLWVKVFFALVTYLSLIIVVHVFIGYPPLTRQLVFIAGAIAVLESLTLSLYGVFRGFQDLRFEAIGSTMFQVVSVGLGVIGLALAHNVLIPALTMLAGAATNFVFALVSLVRKHHIRFSIAHTTRTLTYLVQVLWPFLIAGILTKIYAFIDVVILSFLSDDVHVGWYAAAVKIVLAIQFIPLAFNNSIYPAFSAYFVSSQEKLARLFERSMFFVAAISFPVSFGLFALAPNLVPLLSDAYAESVLALQITAGATFFLFANIIFSSLLNAANAQKKNTLNLGIVVLVNAALDFLLIPPYAHIGASFALVGSSIVLFLINLYWAHRIIAIRYGFFFTGLLKSAFAALVMGVLLWFLAERASVFFLVPLGALVYVGVLRLIGGYQLREVLTFLSRLRNRPNPVA